MDKLCETTNLLVETEDSKRQVKGTRVVQLAFAV